VYVRVFVSETGELYTHSPASDRRMLYSLRGSGHSFSIYADCNEVVSVRFESRLLLGWVTGG